MGNKNITSLEDKECVCIKFTFVLYFPSTNFARSVIPCSESRPLTAADPGFPVVGGVGGAPM